MTQIEIWKWGYFPYTLGGKVHRPIKTTVDVDDRVDLGGGYEGYVVETPAGECFIVEATSGAVIGSTVEAVRQDIAAGDPDLMRDQVSDSLLKRKNAQVLTPDEFFRPKRA